MGNLEHDLTAQGMELRETHISRVFLANERVYKTKKSVQLGFLDFSTLALRRAACDQEVQLNRRLAPDVYCGVVPITRDARGVHHVNDEEGEPVEWAVEMKRLADRDAADQRLRAGRLTLEHLRLIAARLARFHADARCDAETERYGTLEVIRGNVDENFEQTRDRADRFIDARAYGAIEQAQHAFLREHADRLEARLAGRRIRDGHGDLRLEHCYLDDAGGVNIIDCIEFNDRFRYADVCADIAFLAMDLREHERPDLSEALLAFYAEESEDYDLYGVVDFYQSYRAFVRAKVSSILEADEGAAPDVRARAGATARKYYLLSQALTREPLDPPRLIAVGGVIASGKSTVAARLAFKLQGPAVAADRTRKRMAGVDPLTPLPAAPFDGHYTEELTEAVYAELLRRAELILRSGRSVVLDASFRARSHRLAARALAQRCAVQFRFIECVASPEVSRARLAERARGKSISDGRVEVYDAFVKSFEPVTELSAEHALRVDTSGPLEETLACIDAQLP
jgi:aminoglycoside phosphotransferase family enzyme/predicted kinase